MIVLIILGLAITYILTGAVFAIVFFLRGIYVVDESTKDGSIGFKVIIIPGVIMLWPALLRRWKNALKTKVHEPATT